MPTPRFQDAMPPATNLRTLSGMEFDASDDAPAVKKANAKTRKKDNYREKRKEKKKEREKAEGEEGKGSLVEWKVVDYNIESIDGITATRYKFSLGSSVPAHILS
ncbi:hypothetical protein RSOLAG22IIIB_09551 [Rhizoctonia solani]|uniref:Uncharacterized protein n=1 Tax=Rhizoctonia solani TaxID=456999 RepID=A0A0K6FZ87_9AGAM|nr:hypothetical protein RSOLAG22IIIB_09551 [Rhizoctonia solani]